MRTQALVWLKGMAAERGGRGGPLAVFVLLVATIIPAALSLPAVGGPLVDREPIRINGDGEFTAANGVVRGDGSVSNPYVIEGWRITNASRDAGIVLNATSRYCVIRDVSVNGSGQKGGAGIGLFDASHVTVENLSLEELETGLYAFGSKDIRIVGNSLRNVEHAVMDYRTEGFEFLDNEVTGQRRSFLAFLGSANLSLEGNHLERGGFGLELFPDDISKVGLTSPNTIGGLPLQVITGLHDTSIADRAVGQMILVNASNVTLTNITVVDGGGVSIVVSRNITVSGARIARSYPSVNIESSENVWVQDSLFEACAGPCVGVDNSFGVQVSGIEVNNSTASGISVSGGDGVTIRDNRVEDTAGEGITARGAANVTIERNTVESGGMAGIQVDRDWNPDNTVALVRGLRIEGNTVRDGGSGIRVSCADCFLRFNTVAENRGDGIFLEADSGARVEGNLVEGNGVGVRTSSGGGYAFANNTVRRNAEAGFRIGSTDVSLTGNRIEGNGRGVALYFWGNLSLSANTFHDDGLWLGGSPHYSAPRLEVSQDNTIDGRPIRAFVGSDMPSLTSGELGQLVVLDCTNVSFSGLSFLGAETAVQFIEVKGGSLKNVTISGAYGIAIELLGTEGVTLEGNRITGLNGSGISLLGGRRNTVRGNAIESINGTGISLEEETGDVVRDNSLNGTVVGIDVNDCGNLTLHDNEVRSMQGVGIHVWWLWESSIRWNRVDGATEGLWLVHVWNTSVAANTFTHVKVGANLTEAWLPDFSRNEISHTSGPALRLNDTYAVFFANNFVDNAVRLEGEERYAYFWQGYYTGGNFWSDARGADNCHGWSQRECGAADGFQDSAFVVLGGKKDYQPLAVPYVDADRDGMADTWERRYGFSPSDPSDAGGDPDGDGLTNIREFELGGEPDDPDTDYDTLLDGVDPYVWSPNQTLFDARVMNDILLWVVLPSVVVGVAGFLFVRRYARKRQGSTENVEPAKMAVARVVGDSRPKEPEVESRPKGE